MRALDFPAGRSAVAALALLTVLSTPLTGPAVADPERRLEEVRRRLDATAAQQIDGRERLREARGGYEAVDERRRRAIGDLRAVERRQAELAGRLAVVEAELEEAQDTLATAEGRLGETAAALAVGEARLGETRAELERRRDRFAARARAAYKHGGGGYASLALDLSDAAVVGRGLVYMERVIDHDHATVEEIANLQRQVEEQVAALEGLRERQGAQLAVAERERDRLADVLVEQQALDEQVAAEAERHRRLVTELDADRDSYLVLVDDLEAQSAALETELARLGTEESEAHEQVRRVEQERREAEERARAEAEERARAEAEERARAEAEAEERARAEAEAEERARAEAEAEERAHREAEEAEARRAAASEPEQASGTGEGQGGSRASRSSRTPAPRSTPSPARSPSSPPPQAPPSPDPPSPDPPSPSVSPTPGSGTAQLARPVAGAVTSGYGYRTHPIHGDRRLHAGIDFGAPHGSPVTAAAAGTVVTAGDRGGYGLTVIVDHGRGLTTLYAHLSAFSVSSGQRVTAGQVLGAVGSTGFSTGPHLHFEVRVNGQPRDPAGYL